MSRALSPSFARCYGLARVARVWKISRASVYRSLKQTPPTTITCRPGPVGACSDAELADHIRRQIDASRLHGEGYRKLWARLRFAGVRASPRRVRRVMRETGLLAPHRVGRTAAKPHDGTITTDKVNEMWGTDMTQTITIREGRANVFVAVEHANSEVVGIHASWSANRFEALEPVRQGVQTGGSTSDLDITHRDRTILTLIVTDDCAGLRLDCEYTRREQTVRTLAGSRIVGLRIAGAPIDEVELGVIRTRAPGRPTSSRPGVAVRRPGLGPRLARAPGCCICATASCRSRDPNHRGMRAWSTRRRPCQKSTRH